MLYQFALENLHDTRHGIISVASKVSIVKNATFLPKKPAPLSERESAAPYAMKLTLCVQRTRKSGDDNFELPPFLYFLPPVRHIHTTPTPLSSHPSDFFWAKRKRGEKEKEKLN